MQIKAHQLAGAIQKQLAPVYLLSGDEPQQLGELADLIRQSAKAQDYDVREVIFADQAFDWKQLTYSTGNLSIFSDKKIIDLKITTTTPGVAGAKALKAYCQQLPPDTLLLITMGKLGKETTSAWFKAIEQVGCIVQVWPIAGQDFITWINNRMRQRGLSMTREAVAMIANRVEGNLLAAGQEIEKLYVLYGAEPITYQQAADAVADSSRYDVFKLVESALSQQTDKVLKILSSLKAEGIAPPIVLWALVREVRILINFKAAQSQSEKELFLKKNGVWGERKQLIEASSKKLSHAELNSVLVLGAKADRQIKGQQQGDAWETLLEAYLGLASVTVLGKAG